MAGFMENPAFGKTGRSSSSQLLVCVYTVFFAFVLYVFHFVAKSEFSVVLTLSAMAQCLAFLFLVLQVWFTESVSGISARGLALDALALCWRLSSTSWLLGYLPLDASGDYMYQLTDVFSLVTIVWLLYQALVVKRSTYDENLDNFAAIPIALLSLALGVVFHADLNDRPVFDTLWMAGTIVSMLAAIPQLSLIARSGGLEEALTSHHVAALALSRMLSGAYMYSAAEDITCHEMIPGVNHALLMILGVHVIHLLLLADFMYYFFVSMVHNGLDAKFSLDYV